MARVILLQPKQRLLEKVRSYVDSPREFAKNKEKAVSDLLHALPGADSELRHKIMMVLAEFAKEQAAEPLLEILKDPGQSSHTRHYAAVQLCAVLPFVPDSSRFIKELVVAIHGPDFKLRRFAVTAMGWRGNPSAYKHLASRLYDQDLEVRLAAVNALCNCGDERVLNLMMEKLDCADPGEIRAVLYNLWRIDGLTERVLQVYMEYLESPRPELRLVSLAILPLSGNCEEDRLLVEKRLADPDFRVRKLALERFTDLGPAAIAESEPHLRNLFDDENMDIKRSALELVKSIKTD